MHQERRDHEGVDPLKRFSKRAANLAPPLRIGRSLEEEETAEPEMLSLKVARLATAWHQKQRWHNRCAVLAGAGSLLLLAILPAVAEDTKIVVSAGLTIYTYIVETESVINTCRHIDVSDATSYDKVFNTMRMRLGKL